MMQQEPTEPTVDQKALEKAIDMIVDKTKFASPADRIKYKECVLRNLGRLDQWYAAHPKQSAPPIWWNTDLKCYQWLNRKALRRERGTMMQKKRAQIKILKRKIAAQALAQQDSNQDSPEAVVLSTSDSTQTEEMKMEVPADVGNT